MGAAAGGSKERLRLRLEAAREPEELEEVSSGSGKDLI